MYQNHQHLTCMEGSMTSNNPVVNDHVLSIMGLKQPDVDEVQWHTMGNGEEFLNHIGTQNTFQQYQTGCLHYERSLNDKLTEKRLEWISRETNLGPNYPAEELPCEGRVPKGSYFRMNEPMWIQLRTAQCVKRGEIWKNVHQNQHLIST